MRACRQRVVIAKTRQQTLHAVVKAIGLAVGREQKVVHRSRLERDHPGIAAQRRVQRVDTDVRTDVPEDALRLEPVDPVDGHRLFGQHPHAAAGADPAQRDERQISLRGLHRRRFRQQNLRQMPLQAGARGLGQEIQPVEQQLELFLDVGDFRILGLFLFVCAFDHQGDILCEGSLVSIPILRRHQGG